MTLWLRCMSGNFFLVFWCEGVEPIEVHFISVVRTYGIFGFELLPFKSQAIGHFPLFVYCIDVDGESIFHEKAK